MLLDRVNLTLCCVLTAFILCGCTERRSSRVTTYRVAEGHVCEVDCHEHFYDKDRKIVVLKDHRHGPGCGHAWTGDRWVVAGYRSDRPTDHRCTTSCSHHHDGRKYIEVSGHKHGRNCGHSYDGDRWVIVKRK